MKAGNIKKAHYIRFKGEPHSVVKTEFYAPGKGSAVNRVRMKNIKTGNVIEFTYKSNEEVEELDVTAREMQFLYRDGNEMMFMDPRTYDQASVPVSLFEQTANFLSPELLMYLVFFEDRVIDVRFPPKVTLTVEHAEDGVAGDTVSAAKKSVRLETGAVIMAPLFIKTGDKVVIDTATGEYLARVT